MSGSSGLCLFVVLLDWRLFTVVRLAYRAKKPRRKEDGDSGGEMEKHEVEEIVNRGCPLREMPRLTSKFSLDPSLDAALNAPPQIPATTNPTF